MTSQSNGSRRHRAALALTLSVALIAAACSDGESEPLLSGSPPESAEEAETASTEDAETPDDAEAPAETAATDDRAFYILPPGNYGGLPTNDDSLDQLPLYDGLTPLRGDITDADLEQYFLREDFSPVGETFDEPTGRSGTTILYDEFGVAHITSETREDLAFGAGWVTARDRGLWLDLGRGAARAAVADIPGIDAFDLVTSGQTFTPSEAAEQLVTDQVQLIRDTYGDEGDEIIADAQAYADGINAYWEANDLDRPPVGVNDVIAVTAFIGSIFGAGGGGEARNAELLSTLQNR
ncbi:MAG: penicillin acylase family protein, partial [Acidimicrobiales bacterium]